MLFRSGSVFVPVDLSVDGKTVLNYVDEVRRQLSSAVLDGAKLDRLFAAEFPQKDFVPPFVPSSGDGFASRIVDFNGEELEQLLDSLYLFQSAYSHYKAILIVDKNSGIKVNATKNAAKKIFFIMSLSILLINRVFCICIEFEIVLR